MPRNKLWLSLSLVVSISAGVGLGAAADTGTENEFVTLINSSRAGSGLAPLQVDGGLQAHARNHTQDMIASGGIGHSSSAELSAAAGSGWSRVGENVGRGQSASSLHGAFMDSPGHMDNILGDFNYVGVGTDSADGYLYVTVVFIEKDEIGPPSTDAPPSTTTQIAPPGTDLPAPTTTTTLASTTTTAITLVVPADKAVVPGQSCLVADRWSRLCHD